jgi:hypothetical protein
VGKPANEIRDETGDSHPAPPSNTVDDGEPTGSIVMVGYLTINLE